MMKRFADAIKEDFVFEGYYGGNLFKQGTELVAIQRGNLEMGNIAPQDVSKQIPAWSIVTAGYLFRDAAHLKPCFSSAPGTVTRSNVASARSSARVAPSSSKSAMSS
jgi:TRAP-type C4-dicarboxylate transport system substrate-binding protein